MVLNTDLLDNLLAVLPEILLVILGVWVLAVDLRAFGLRREQAGYWASVGLLVIAAVNIALAPTKDTIQEQLVLGGMLRHDEFTQIFRTMVYIAAALTCLIAQGDTRLRYKGEFYLIIIVASIGAGLMGGASDLVMVFVALETLSILLYALAGFGREEAGEVALRSSESGLKYFLLGSFASAFLLYGFSLIYGFTGHTNLYEIGKTLSDGKLTDPPIIVALLMMTVGFAFKISAVPFHFWTPDVYEGAPTPMSAYVSVASKAASFALLLRFLLAVFPPSEFVSGAAVNYSELWVPVLSIMAVVTMTLGNFLALVQSNMKRLLAYSSIAQAGYALIGVAAISTTEGGDGAASVAYYMFMYVLTNILAFGCIIVFVNATGSENIKDMAGLGRRNLWLGIFMSVALLSLGGIPPAAGFIGKLLLFRAAIDAGLIWLAVIGVINAIVALYYYLVIIKVMFFDATPDEHKPIPMQINYAWALGLSTVGVIAMGTFLAQVIISWAAEAGLQLFEPFA
jgi:NADH-quinone oxidoreductase subunit N